MPNGARSSTIPAAADARGPDVEWHALSAAEALVRLASSPSGLSSEEAARRLARHGPNVVAAAPPARALSILADQFRNVLVLVLLVAIALSASLGHGVETVVIAVIVVFAVGLGFVQEFRAERAMEALRRMTAPGATVLRDGGEVRVPARDVVPGDVLVLGAGDRVAADARLLEAVELHADEAPLTGESVPVHKRIDALPPGPLPAGDRTDLVFSGTSLTHGRGRAVVVATGAATEFGQIARLLATVEAARTPLQQNLDRVGKALARAAVVVVAVIVALGLARGAPLVEMLVFGIALAVAVVPEALPAVVTISLALGVQRLVRRNALVRRLAAAETLGSTSVICSDKTGTLTRDEMTVRAVHAAGRTFAVGGAGYEPQGEFRLAGAPVPPPRAVRDALAAAALASDARLARSEEGAWRVRGDPTEGALVVAAAKAGLAKDDLDVRCPRIAEVPFTSERKRMTTLHRDGDRTVACVKGAPEVLLPACARVLGDDGERALDAVERDRLLAVAADMAAGALRVLAVARKEVAAVEGAERDLTLLGLVGMIDPPRPEAKDAVARCAAAGIRPVMITGDHPSTARAVAAEVGILRAGRVVTGAELARTSDAELAREAEAIEVYARVSPADKLRIVGALQALGHVVAMTGDGVNDAPALKKADVGIAMGLTGTDVAREAAAMTLTDDQFASIVAAVEEGRAIFANIKKFLTYLLSSNVGEIALMAGASLAGLPLPLSAVQILYVNLATDGLPALALAVDPPDDDLMARPPRSPRVGIFTRPVVALMLASGLWSGLANLALFAWALGSGRDRAEATTMTFLAVVLVQFVNALEFRSDRRSVLHRPFANRWLDLAICWEVGLLLLVVYLPPLQAAFGTFALPARDWAVVVGVALTVAPAVEAVKALVRRGVLGADAPAAGAPA
ncbi:MAG TPA: cation-translocating P-type ATPase [Anaeromyxobacter sp.]|nr:cation-translocating P-type ATPase [Anaeromyxobacter sp.]